MHFFLLTNTYWASVILDTVLNAGYTAVYGTHKKPFSTGTDILVRYKDIEVQ